MKLLVCGGRDYKNRKQAYRVLDKIHQRYPITLLIHGAQKTWCNPLEKKQLKVDFYGADSIAGEWAKKRGVKQKPVPAEWNKYGKAAGFKRNSEMASMNPDKCLAFPGGDGTKMMISILEKKGIKVWKVKKREDND